MKHPRGASTERKMAIFMRDILSKQCQRKWEKPTVTSINQGGSDHQNCLPSSTLARVTHLTFHDKGGCGWTCTFLSDKSCLFIQNLILCHTDGFWQRPRSWSVLAHCSYLSISLSRYVRGPYKCRFLPIFYSMLQCRCIGNVPLSLWKWLQTTFQLKLDWVSNATWSSFIVSTRQSDLEKRWTDDDRLWRLIMQMISLVGATKKLQRTTIFIQESLAKF